MIPGVKSITKSYVDKLIDFAPSEAIRRAGIGDLQRDGAVALFNMLVRNGVGYLADEVGMGKTYIGLAIMHLLRYQKPDARVLIITPRRNIQEKWASDLTSFVHQNWRTADHRVKTPQGTPDWPTLMPDRLSDWVRDVHEEEPHDSVMRMSSFSLGISEDIGDRDELDRFKENLPQYLHAEIDVVYSERTQSKFAETIRKLLAQVAHYDLIIVDESHNLKHGYRPGEGSSIRNESMYHLFSDNKAAGLTGAPWLLLLSATPMENGDPLSLVRQFEVFGRDQAVLRSPDGELNEQVTIRMLGESGPMEQQRQLQKRLIVRRVGELRLNDGSRFTRNMYRQEWRAGGVEEPHLPMQSASPSERLVNAVIQKNVFELIQSRSGGRFRIGALESFEIYSGAASSLTDVDDSARSAEKSLPDQRLIADLCESYRDNFSEEVPHPKLNAVTEMLGRNIRQREKSLVFVRRVATTKDLASRASEVFDSELLALFKSVVLPEQQPILDEIDVVWRSKRASRDYIDSVITADRTEDAMAPGQDVSDEEEDDSVSEVVPSLFTWFFRGEHRGLVDFPNIFSGRRLREQLEARSRFSLVLEENYVDWVLGRPDDILEVLSSAAGISQSDLIVEIAQFVPEDLSSGVNFRRTFHSVQYGALSWMLRHNAYEHIHKKLAILIDEIFGLSASTRQSVGCDSELISEMLTIRGVYPAVARCPQGSSVWRVVARGAFENVDESASFDFRQALRRREQIRHVQVALLRHGAPSVDLYISCLQSRNGELNVSSQGFGLNATTVASLLARRWMTLLDNTGAFRSSGAWELLAVNENFDLIKKLNFPNLDVIKQAKRPLDAVFISGQEPRSDSEGVRSARRMLNQELAGQSPTVAAKGGQTDERRHRITTHFRMPGMPWVVVATSVYEEGVDLHTFCRTVVHHGISHTASSVEQRTGRVDRIGGQVQRETRLMRASADFTDDKKIQSLFPYQNDTFEKYQVRRVLANCNRFLEALHETDCVTAEENEMSISDKQEIPPQITKHLTSPFDIRDSLWLLGVLQEPDRGSEFIESTYLSEVEKLESLLHHHFTDVFNPGGQGLERHYGIGKRYLKLFPRSHREGDHLVMDFEVDGCKVISLDATASGSGWSGRAIRVLEDVLAKSG